MWIPKYWAQVEHTLFDESGRQLKVRLYGWSDKSVSDAQSCARWRAAKITKIPTRGISGAWYLYGDRPLRELIISDHSKPGYEVLVTRSRHGTKVLNTDRIAFIDIDVYQSHHPIFGSKPRHGFFAKLLGKKDPMIEKENEIRQWFAENPRIGMRLYRTKNGFRGLFTHSQMEPTAGETEKIFNSLGADPLYVRLCKGQDCFRARLTAKPWRIAAPVLSAAYPYTFDAEEKVREECRKFDEETAVEYDKMAANYASCHFVEHLGSRSVAAEAARVAELHDELSGAHSGKELA